MNKQSEALKLAQDLRALADRFSEGWHDGIKIDASDIVLLTDASEALAQSRSDEEQPRGEATLAQQQVIEHAPCQGMNCGITRTDQEHSMECQAEHAAAIAGGAFMKPAKQQVPSIIQMLGHCPECGAKAHHFTSPQPSQSRSDVKPWVGLTPAEAGALWKVGMTPNEFSCAIEAKLREKNNG